MPLAQHLQTYHTDVWGNWAPTVIKPQQMADDINDAKTVIRGRYLPDTTHTTCQKNPPPHDVPHISRQVAVANGENQLTPRHLPHDSRKADMAQP
jgi:hypothetical protein